MRHLVINNVGVDNCFIKPTKDLWLDPKFHWIHHDLSAWSIIKEKKVSGQFIQACYELFYRFGLMYWYPLFTSNNAFAHVCNSQECILSLYFQSLVVRVKWQGDLVLLPPILPPNDFDVRQGLLFQQITNVLVLSVGSFKIIRSSILWSGTYNLIHSLLGIHPWILKSVRSTWNLGFLDQI
jgi:hypothetical protein